MISYLPSPHPTLQTIEIKLRFWLTEYNPQIWSDFSEISEVLSTRSDDPQGVLEMVKISVGLALELRESPMSDEMKKVCLEGVREEALKRIVLKGDEDVLLFNPFMTKFQESLR